ncbi:MAG: hypothetical protein WBQ29_11535, partial [Isosphaeraceae bacterium]
WGKLDGSQFGRVHPRWNEQKRLGIVASGEWQVAREEWSMASEAGGSEWRCKKSAERTQLESAINRLC